MPRGRRDASPPPPYTSIPVMPVVQMIEYEEEEEVPNAIILPPQRIVPIPKKKEPCVPSLYMKYVHKYVDEQKEIFQKTIRVWYFGLSLATLMFAIFSLVIGMVEILPNSYVRMNTQETGVSVWAPALAIFFVLSLWLRVYKFNMDGKWLSLFMLVLAVLAASVAVALSIWVAVTLSNDYKEMAVFDGIKAIINKDGYETLMKERGATFNSDGDVDNYDHLMAPFKRNYIVAYEQIMAEFIVVQTKEKISVRITEMEELRSTSSQLYILNALGMGGVLVLLLAMLVIWICEVYKDDGGTIRNNQLREAIKAKALQDHNLILQQEEHRQRVRMSQPPERALPPPRKPPAPRAQVRRPGDPVSPWSRLSTTSYGTRSNESQRY